LGHAHAEFGADPGRFAGNQRQPRERHGSVGDGLGAVADAEDHVGLAPHFLQVALVFLFELAAADGVADLGAAVVVGDIGLATGDALDDVPAGVGAERLRDLAVLQRGHLAAEFRAVGIGREPAQVAALAAGAVVLGGLARDFLEVGAAGDARAQGVDLGAGGRGVLAVVDADQDVADVVLGDGLCRGLGAVAHLGQAQQLEAAGAAHRAEDLARLQLQDLLGERRRDLVQRTPARVAAFQRVGAVGVAHRGGGEVHLALVDDVEDALDLALAGGDLLGGGAVGQRDQDVRQAVLAAAGGLAGEGGVDLALADVDALDEALAQA